MKFPLKKDSGSGSVRIYKSSSRVKGKKYTAYTVRYYADGKPHVKKFGSFDGPNGADKFADDVLARINAGSLAVMTLTEYDRAQLAEAKQILGGRATMVEAAREWVKNHAEEIIVKQVSAVIEELIAAKEADKLSDDWIRELKIRLGSFKKKFGTVNMSELSGTEIETWIRDKGVGTKTRKNFRGVLSTLVSFAKLRSYVPDSFNILKHVSRLKTTPKDKIEVFTPEEFCIWYHAASEQMRLLLLFGCFAGMRHKEITRLEWKDIRWEDDVIAVNWNVSKVRERRLGALLPVLKEWLEPFKDRAGKIITIKGTHDAIAVLARRVKRKWKHNAPIHSYISYRVAITQNSDMVSDETGKSVEKIKTNYRKQVFKREAEEWFALTPAKFTNLAQTLQQSGKMPVIIGRKRKTG
ncbi:MAG: hypothetical protein JWM68_3773 [Verrucomicrobiales bacterium]|nr:hypothetical protein [Verrucomicrobiales bacterium]